jgi:putative redox protein
MPLTATVRSAADTLRQEVLVGDRHRLVTDEPRSLGGTDSAPTPWELLPAALAACVVTTIRMYARRKGWELDDIAVDAALHHETQPQRCTITLRLPDALSDEQRRRLEHVARACAVHRTLEHGLAIEQTIAFAAPA